MPLSVSQVNPEETPQNFFLPRIVDEGLETEHIVYDIPHEELTVGSGKKLKKKVKGGVQSQHLDPDGTCYIYYDTGSGEQLIASWYIQAQYWQANKWRNFQRAWQYVDIVDGRLQGSGVQGDFSWNIDIPCTYGAEKWTVHVTAPGVLMRAIWHIEFTALGQSLLADPESGFKLNYSDFSGPVSDDEGTATREIIFYPDGVSDTFEIDPYIGVEEIALYIYVDGTGWSMRFSNNANNESDMFRLNSEGYRDSPIEYCVFWNSFRPTGTAYFSLAEDTSEYCRVVENTPNRAVISAKGNLYDSGAPLTNSSSIEYIWTCYEWGAILDVIWITSGGNITKDTNNRYDALTGIDADSYQTCTDYYRNAGGSETAASTNTDYNSTQYLFIDGNECNIQIIPIRNVVSGGTFNFHHDDQGEVNLQFTGTTTPGTHRITVAYLFDSTGRWAEADRKLIGDQFTSGTNATISTGTAQTDWNIPDNIDDDGLATDGARQIAASSNEVSVDINQSEYAPAFVLDEFTIQSGDPSSPTTYTLGKFRFEDNAANATVDAIVGNDGNWEEADGTSRNTSNDTVDGGAFRGRCLDTKDTYHVDMTVTAYDNDFFKKGSFAISFIPQFAYNDAADQTLYHLYVDSDDYIKLVYDAGNDKYELRVSWGGTLATADTDALTSGKVLNVPTQIHCAWNSDNDQVVLAFNGKVVDVQSNTGTPSASAPTYCYLAAECDGDGTSSLNADIYLDYFEAWDACILPYGGYPTLYDQVGDYSKAHKNITFFEPLDNLSETTPAIGTGSIVVTGSPDLQDGPYGTSNAMRFDASGEYVTVPTSGNISLSAGSISFWFKGLSSFAEATNRYIFGGYGTGAASGDFYIAKVVADIFIINFIDSSNASHYIYFDSLSIVGTMWQKWNHYLIRWNASNLIDQIFNINMYFNGVYVFPDNSYQASSSWTPGTAPTYYAIGNDYQDTSRYANGIIKDFFITNNVGTPQCWTAMGKELNSPLIEVG